ncbi:alpha-L-rhamnosidase [Microbacterium sp. zg.Y909]|uniref:alpha-L-rhamnosidase n=1 Tax=Microbacterium sp. zg.Y909 TaxID=2969413 RepID=UPI00214B7FE8|nr:alpha-L-rhamnosidase [Microbacterium sp. zg.Y909]MCR2824368.1 glycoside hydrolase family 78 protein [Microbacterium sp. zg.Y909]
MSSTRVTRIGTGAPYGSDVVPSATPVLSWVTETDSREWRQAAAEISFTVVGQEHLFALEGSTSVGVPWPFAELSPREHGQLSVRVVGSDGQWSEWSAPRAIVAGFLGEGGWQAATIGASSPASYAEPVLLRTEFTLDRPVARAFFYATALGVYQAAVNGADVDDHVMKPGWTAYQERLLHESTDITALVRDGVNAIGVRLAGGWATQHYGFAGNWHPVYGEQPRFAGQIVVEHTDGTVRTIATGDGWMLGRGPITQSGLYDGEDFDARRAAVDAAGVGFAEPGFAAEGWEAAALQESLPVPETSAAPFVRRIEERAVEEVILTPSERTVLDFGQNLVGRLRIRVSGPAGTVITLRHAEVLEHGELGIRPLREAKATDTYILAGDGEETWEPEFTFHGFRYAEVEGWPGEFDPNDVTAVVIHSDMERTGWFETSHPLLNRLHENVVWGLRGNFLSIPTDCPQRDERLGWTGDIQVFAPTASFLYDVQGFLDSWLKDLAIDQVDGVVPFVVPNVLGPARPAAAWGDAATVVPDVLHERFGQDEITRRQYPSMKGWVDAVLARAGERRLWEGSFQFGDWLDPDAPPHNAAKAKTDPDIVASASLFHSTRILARTAARLGFDDDARQYARIAEEVREAFLAEYVTPVGRMVSDAQTAYALAIVFEIVDKETAQALGDRLAVLTRANGFHIGTGFVGTPIIQDALTRTGHLETARRLLLQTGCPSWLYPVTMGATTIWERWDSMLPDGSINPGEMTSFNHYALGAVADWLHRVVAGLAPAAPGYKRIEIAPHPLAGIDSAAATHRTPYGVASASWRRDGDVVHVEAVVPPNTTAAVLLPDGSAHEVGSGTHRWSAHLPQPPVARGSVGLETTLDVIIDDEEAHDALMAELLRVDARASDIVRSHTSWGAGSSVRDLLHSFVGGDLVAVVTERFDELNQRRGASV